MRPLLSLLADVVDTESHFLECRARAVEAFATKAPGGLEAGGLELDAQHTLQLLNDEAAEAASAPTATGMS